MEAASHAGSVVVGVLGKMSPSRQTASAHGSPTGLLLLPILLSASPLCSLGHAWFPSL